jgi:protocatechuate 3,4-dioxygenase, beta subunit
MSTLIHPVHIRLDRRRLLKSLLMSTAGVITSDIYAEALTLTPGMTEGPYYPDHLPLDQDNNLLSIKDDTTQAAGVIAEFGGRLLNADGKPMKDHLIEVWQADNNGCYIHSRGTQRNKERDPHFQGYGKITTNDKGEYRFRTIKPGLYTGRTIHWHVSVNKGAKRLLTTQLFIAGVEQNDRDGVLKGVRDEAQRLSVIREFKPKSPDSKEEVGTWDIVLGDTPDERQMSRPPGQQRGKGPRRERSAADEERAAKEALYGRSVFDS